MGEIIDKAFLSDIYDANNNIKEIFKANFDELAKDFESSSIANIGRIMAVFCLRTEFISEAIYYLCKMANIYSANILFRSLIEHFLKQQYIFFRYAIEQNEKVCDEYYKYYGNYEYIHYINVLKKNNEILESRELNDNELKFLNDIVSEIKKNPEFEIMKKCYKKFQYIEILKYIYGNLKKVEQEKVEQENIPLLKLIIPEYCRLSSFVHAGPQAELQLYKYMEKDNLIYSLENIAETSLYMRAGILSTTFLIGSSINDKYIEISREIIKAAELKNRQNKNESNSTSK